MAGEPTPVPPPATPAKPKRISTDKKLELMQSVLIGAININADKIHRRIDLVDGDIRKIKDDHKELDTRVKKLEEAKPPSAAVVSRAPSNGSWLKKIFLALLGIGLVAAFGFVASCVTCQRQNTLISVMAETKEAVKELVTPKPAEKKSEVAFDKPVAPAPMVTEKKVPEKNPEVSQGPVSPVMKVKVEKDSSPDNSLRLSPGTVAVIVPPAGCGIQLTPTGGYPLPSYIEHTLPDGQRETEFSCPEETILAYKGYPEVCEGKLKVFLAAAPTSVMPTVYPNAKPKTITTTTIEFYP